MATCLSQIYHENKMGRKSGYAKFETFPIWNIPLGHPVNLAYEAATADLADVNMIDPFHLEAYGVTTVNYNRDVEVFPVLRAMFREILGECPYKSPTDMGVNMAGFCIYDDEAVCAAARQEIIRRYYAALCNRRQGAGNDVEVSKIEMLMQQLSIDVSRERRCVVMANAKAEETSWRCIDMPDNPYTMTPEQIYMQKETGEALEAGLEKCSLRGRAYLMYRFGFDDGQEHSEAVTARRYHLKRSWARRLEEDSLEILKNHLIACGEYCGNTKKELTEVG
jgi:uncharacterized protein (UPF0371 family)